MDEFTTRTDLLSQENYQPEATSPCGTPEDSTIGSGVTRSDLFEIGERETLPYVPEFKRYTQFFSTVDVNELFSTLGLYVDRSDNINKFQADKQSELTGKYAYSATMATDSDSPVTFTVNMLKCDSQDQKYCVEVVKESGDRFEFDQIYKGIREFFGGYVNAKV